jgi:hypothetical protein
MTSAVDSSSRRPKRVLRLAALTLAALALNALAFAGRADAFVYWTSPGLSSNTSGMLGRANLDGSDVNNTFESSPNYPQGVAVDSTDGYIYWTNSVPHGASTIGRETSMAAASTAA